MAYSHPFPTSTITSRFGETAGRTNPHRGVDYAPGGPPAPSIVTGRVVRSEWHSGLGNIVVIRNDVDGYYIGYAHLLERWVSVGTRVVPGQMIGVVGATGTLQNGRHLHFTVSNSSDHPAVGGVIDPIAYIGSGSSTAGGGTTDGLSADTQKKYQQFLTNKGLYDGLVDGAFGQKSWAGVQQHLKNEGVYGGPVDGDPGINTIKGMQTIAQRGGYGGPIDGEWGPNSDAGLNAWLSSQLAPAPAPGGDFGLPVPSGTQKKFQQLLTNKGLYTGLVDGAWGELSWIAIQKYMNAEGVYGGPADGDPGQFSYEGLQKLAQRAGYTGPIDGVLGERSLEGLDNYLSQQLSGGGVVTPPPPPPAEPVIPTLPNGQLFGIDIATSQAGIDLAKFKAQGGRFAIIKMGGGNTSDSPYTAPQYLTQVQGARTAGLRLGHYWFNGQKISVAAQAKYFADNIKLLQGDLIALDIEAETATGTRAFTPAEAMEFITEFQKKWPGAKFLLYMSASVVRAVEWDALVAAGHLLWVAAYNNNDGTIGSAPTIDDWPDWLIWQYSSVVKVPGGVGNTDANIAKADLFEKAGYKVVVPEPDPEPDLAAFYTETKGISEELAALIQKYSR